MRQKNSVIPADVKRGTGSTLRSMQSFLESHKTSSFGIRFSTQNYSEYQNIKSYPLYAVSQMMSQKNKELSNAINFLLIE
jgi:hypothetical protein